jgi:DNA polymerase-3 subunit epsilon
MRDDQHALQPNETGGYTCSRCCLSWKQAPSGTCPGVKVYNYTAIPWDTLATYTMLKRQKLKPADEKKPDGCYFRLKGKEYIYLYRVDQAQPRRKPTEAQREAIAKMQAGLKRAYTCERCGWYDETHGQLRGRGRYRYNQIGVLKVEGEEKRYCEECREYLIWVYDRHVIEHNMHVWLESESAPAFLVLDTETTGLPDSEGFQVVEVAAVDKSGAVVLHSLVKPDISMPAAASQVNGLTDEDLKDAPSFAEIWPRLAELLSQYELWTYNASFDQAAILASAERFKLDIPKPVKSSKRWHCLMLEYARYYGEYSEYWGSDKWQDLYTACSDLEVKGNDYHRATGDALNALGVMKALAARGGTYPAPEDRPIYQGSGDYYGGDY